MIGVAAAAVVIADVVGRLVHVAGRGPVEPAFLAVALGLLVRHAALVPARYEVGVQAYEAFLKVGVVLLGLTLTFVDVVRLGAGGLGVIVLCLVTAPGLIWLLGRWLGMAERLAVLIGVGTTICGSTAIAVASPVIGAKEEETAYAIGTISLFGVIAMLGLPLAGSFLAMTDVEFGLWAGTAVPATPQVVGAAYMYSDGAGIVATVVKMTRNLFIVPAVIVLGLWHAGQRLHAGRAGARAWRKAMPAFLVAFIALVLVRTIVDRFALVPATLWQPAVATAGNAAKALFVIAMAGIGLSTRLGRVRTIGRLPLLVGLTGALVLALVSYTATRTFGAAALTTW